MDHFKKLPIQCVAEIFEYNPSNVSDLKNTNHSMRDIIDGDKNIGIWSSLLDNTRAYVDSDLRFLKGGSLVETALLLRESEKTCRCLICKSVAYLSYHPFYNILVCRSCNNSQKLKVRGWKKTLKDNFLDVSDAPSLMKRKYSNYYNVMESHVEKIAEEKYPNGELGDKKSMRSFQRELTNQNKPDSHRERMSLLKTEYVKFTRECACRMDIDLLDLNILMHLVNVYHLQYVIYEDYMHVKVRCSVSRTDVLTRLRDLGWMLTHMREVGFLGTDYKVLPEHVDNVRPRCIFVTHFLGCSHYYVAIANIVNANSQYTERFDRMEKFINMHKLTSDNRRQLAIISSTEDGIDMDEYIFEDFINNGNGNPVNIAREKRKDIFLNANGYINVYSSHIHMGMDPLCARRYAKEVVLKRTRGFRQMFVDCNITLSILV